MTTAEQQRELDAWIASKERCLGAYKEYGEGYVNGYNDGASAAAEAIRQGNWSWEDYQAHLMGSH